MSEGRRPLFRLEAQSGSARAGLMDTPHGRVDTPAFMPVATQGSVKALDSEDLVRTGARIVLANTYHLYLRPGVEVIRDLGGLHGFMAWDGPVLTDSGGFQGFSLEHLRELDERGILFKSHLDGSLHRFTPEAVVEHQAGLGADIAMPLDVCEPAGAERGAVEESVHRTLRWARRSLDAHGESRQALFGIVQGGVFDDLRELSAAETVAMGFPGYAIGGLSVGESKSEMYDTTELTARLLPGDRPRYLMGVGSPEDLVECVARGIDMFDCVLPTRIARSGALCTRAGRVNVNTAPFRAMDAPVDEDCDCYTCGTFPAAYLCHLFRAKELLAYRLATIHNLRFVLGLMEQMREAIVEGRFESFRRDFADRFTPPDERTRRDQKQKWLSAMARTRTHPGDFGQRE